MVRIGLSPFLWILNPSWFETQLTPLHVETHNPHLRGITYTDPTGAKPLPVSTRLREPDKARQFLLDLLEKA